MAHVLALIDGSVYAESVCDHAAWFARGLGLPVSVVHVLGRREQGGPPLALGAVPGSDPREVLLQEIAARVTDRSGLAQRRAQMVLDAARARIVRHGVGTVSTMLRQGDFVAGFESVATGAVLGVLGKRGESADHARGSLGSNLERAVRASPVPLLVAGRAFRPVHRLVVAFDGGPSAVRAVSHIAQTPLYDDCAVRLLTVGLPDAETIRLREQALRDLVAHGHSPEALELSGDPATAISEHVEASGSDLLLMGAYSHSRLRNMVIGSTTTEVLRACRVPVLLFR